MPWEEISPEDIAEKLPSVMGVGREGKGRWEEVDPSTIYEAQDRPGTAGYGLVDAPDGVAAMPSDVSPSPFAGMLRSPLAAPQAPPQVPRFVPPAPQQVAPQLPMGSGPPVEIPIMQPGQALAQAELQAQAPPIPEGAGLGRFIPDAGTPGRAGAALGRMWGRTERGGKYDALGHGFVNHGINALLRVPKFAENLEENGKQAALWLTEQMGAGSPELRTAVENAPSVARGWRKISPFAGPKDLRAEDVRALPEAFPGGKSFEDSRREQLARTQGLKLTHPTAYGVGEGLATAAEVVGLSKGSGAAKLMKVRDVGLTKKIKEAQEAKLVREGPEGASAWAGQKLSSPMRYKLGKGIGRAGETTVEGWVTAALNEGDPMEMAAIAGLGQGAASPIMALASIKGKPGRGRLMTALGKAAVAGTAIAVWELLPGGDEKTSIQQLDSGMDKVKAGILTNMFFGAIGLGRTRTQDWAQTTRFADDISNVTRAGTLATVERFAGADDRAKNKVRSVLKTMASRPDTYKPHTLDQLTNGLTRGGDHFFNVIEKLDAEGEL